MEATKEQTNQPMFPQPLEVKIADAFFLKMNKNTFLIKDLKNPKVHYYIYFKGSTLNCHVTIENRIYAKKKHINLLDIQIDLDSLFKKIALDILAGFKSTTLYTTTLNNPKLKDLKIRCVNIETFDSIVKNYSNLKRVNIEESLLKKFDESVHNIKVSDLAGKGVIFGQSKDGTIILSDGISKCIVLNLSKIMKIVEKNLEMSIRKVSFRFLTLRTLIWITKIRLLNLNRIITSCINGKTTLEQALADARQNLIYH